ncbi:mitochondrial ribosomal protein l27 domain-containing protein [Ditylenchus destructor]|uniref:Mitochondrial ribosomal protein l27 domain-containing protein n=1 Tax=Ditylenchus destructor TaxID=166010 RepID=A0AAD4N0E6_9BILA|nr:mitochondrial ribosomal protein l27 domain-containing protein [Ditylenchus destructor]
MVRSIAPRHFRSAWPFNSNVKGWRKIGPLNYEKHKYPGQNKEFPELNPKFQKNNLPELRGYTGVQPTGYVDPQSGDFVHVPEMRPQLVVPDLTDFDLKPYVSYRTDAEIEKKRETYEKEVRKYGSEEAADRRIKKSDIFHWPPPKADAKSLFDATYAEKVREAYEERKTGAPKPKGWMSLFGSKEK